MWKYESFSFWTSADMFDERGCPLQPFKSAEQRACEFLNEKHLRPDQVKISVSVQDMGGGSMRRDVYVWWVED